MAGIPALVICLIPLPAITAQGQTAETSQRCEVPAAQAASHGMQADSSSGLSATPEADGQSGFEAQESGMKLSLPPSAPAAPQAQPCNREHPDQHCTVPATPAVQTAEEPQASDPAPAAPVAQYADGKLTIHANGQDLAAVLEAVKSASGIAVDMPPDNGAEPIFMNLGPVPVKEALIAIVEGTKYNYIIVGSSSDPQLVRRITLIAQSTPTPTETAAAAPAAPPQPQLYGGVPADTESENVEPVVTGRPIQPAEIPSSVPTGVDIQQLAQQQGKSPGQILDELQKRQLEVLDQQYAAQPGSQPQ